MSKEKDYAIIICDGCGRESKIEFGFVSEIIGIKCPKCNSGNIWYTNIIQHENDNTPLGMGRGGRGKAG